MLKDVTLGQYFPGETAVHKMDPRTKLVLVIVYIVALFLAKGAAGYTLVAGCLLAVVFRLGRCKPLGNEICRMVSNRVPSLLADVLLVLRL